MLQELWPVRATDCRSVINMGLLNGIVIYMTICCVGSFIKAETCSRFVLLQTSCVDWDLLLVEVLNVIQRDDQLTNMCILLMIKLRVVMV
jgi:hypothetical protein